MKHAIENGTVNVNVDQMQEFVMIRNVGIMINADINANN